jgi:hypothetical protein
MLCWLRPFMVIALMALEGSLVPVHARSATATEERWNPQHLKELPAEIRGAVAAYARACGGTLAAEHSFALYFQRGKIKLIGLHFEHLRCRDRHIICTAAGCLHQVYISTGGRYRLMQSGYGPELDLTRVKMHDEYRPERPASEDRRSRT